MNTLSNEIAQVARAALDYIDALPPEVVARLPTMPGFDRDWAEDVLRKEREAVVPVAVVDIQRGRGDGRKYALCYTSLGHSLPDDVYNLYAYPQPVAVPELFVQGVIDDGENCAYADDDEAQYFTVYRRNADGTADALMDFTNRVNTLWAISLVKKLNKVPESNS